MTKERTESLNPTMILPQARIADLTPSLIARSERLLLRRTQTADLGAVIAAERAAENARYIIQWSHAQHAETMRSSDAAHLIIETNGDDRMAGYAILAGLSGHDRSIELIRLVITHKRQGYGREALRLIRQVAFERLGAHRLWLDVMMDSEAARNLYRSEGFHVEGILRECIYRDEGWESLIVMSMLDYEYRAGGRPATGITALGILNSSHQ